MYCDEIQKLTVFSGIIGNGMGYEFSGIYFRLCDDQPLYSLQDRRLHIALE